MQRSQWITAALCAVFVPVAACNRAYDNDADSPSAPAAEDSAVATSGTLPADYVDDATVTSRIQARFFLEDSIKGRRIQVDTHNGIVTLRGEVASDNERAQALLIARTTEGAERVEDGLTVNAGIDASTSTAAGSGQTGLPAPPIAADEALTALVQSRLGDDTALNAATTIAVTVKDGVVLLDGTAPTASDKQRVLSIARGTDGVAQVVDRIRVTR
jgi:hyperosmotically inducible protein